MLFTSSNTVDLLPDKIEVACCLTPWPCTKKDIQTKSPDESRDQ
jgi:hypothetical protein